MLRGIVLNRRPRLTHVEELPRRFRLRCKSALITLPTFKEDIQLAVARLAGAYGRRTSLAVRSGAEAAAPAAEHDDARLEVGLERHEGRVENAAAPRAARGIAGEVPREADGIEEVVDGRTLVPVKEAQGTVLIALAVQIGPARLIDNIVVDVD